MKGAVHKNSKQDRVKTQRHTNKLIHLWDWKDKAHITKYDLGIWIQILQRNKCRHLDRKKPLDQRKCVLDQILTASLCLCTALEMESHTHSASLYSWITLALQHGEAEICVALAPWPWRANNKYKERSIVGLFRRLKNSQFQYCYAT